MYYQSIKAIRKGIRGLFLASCVFVLLSFPALVRETASETGKIASEQLETITVTANKQEENVQDVPASITVLDVLAIEDKQIENINELGDFVPNLMIFSDGPAGINSPSMRGIHADAESLSVSTGLFIDEIPVSSTLGFSSALLDIERIEVLRGPQGTLYGKNKEVGAINIITRQPDNTFRGKISGQLGEDETRQISFSLNGPIIEDKLFFGFAGQYHEEDGFIKHTVSGGVAGDREYLYGKGHLRWIPREDLEVRFLMAHIQHDNGAYRMGPNPAWWSVFFTSLPGDREVSSDNDAFGTAEENSQALKISYDINEALVLTSTTTHRAFDDVRGAHVDFTSFDFLWRDFDSTYRTLSEELRLTCDTGGWKWLMGVYFDKNDYHIREQASSTPRNYEVDGYSYAVFGQATVPLTSQLSVIGGLRYEEQHTDFMDKYTGSELDGSWENISPKLALEYKVHGSYHGLRLCCQRLPLRRNQLPLDRSFQGYLRLRGIVVLRNGCEAPIVRQQNSS